MGKAHSQEEKARLPAVSYLIRIRLLAVGTEQIGPPLPGNQKPGLAPGFLVPESGPLNDRLSPEGGQWSNIGSKARK